MKCGFKAQCLGPKLQAPREKPVMPVTRAPCEASPSIQFSSSSHELHESRFATTGSTSGAHGAQTRHH